MDYGTFMMFYCYMHSLQVWQPLVIVYFHCMEASSSSRVWEKRENEMFL